MLLRYIPEESCVRDRSDLIPNPGSRFVAHRTLQPLISALYKPDQYIILPPPPPPGYHLPPDTRPSQTSQAERNRTMGKRQRELRAELERREKEAANGPFSSPSGGGRGGAGGGGLGAGGEARVAAAKLDELRKKGEAERQRQSADWSVKSASAKKRSARSSGLPGAGDGDDDDGLEERTLRVKWKSKKESHSDYTLDVLFSKFGVVQSLSIEEGRGDRALVVFASAASADAAMAAYGDQEGSETMRTSYVGKRRSKRSAFAPRRQTVSPKTPTPGWGAGAGAGEGEEGESLSSFRDHESVVMMNLRKEGERQALMRKMAEEDGLPVDGGKDAAAEGGGGAVGAGAEAAAAVASTPTRRTGGVEGGRGRGGSPGSSSSGSRRSDTTSKADPNNASEKGDGDVAAGAAAAATQATPAARNGGPTPSRTAGAGAGGGVARETRPAFPVPSPMTVRVMPAPNDVKSRRKSDALLPAMMRGGSGGAGFGSCAPTPPAVSAFGLGSKSMPTTPVSGRGAAGQAIDESDILARMMAMKR